MAAVQVALVAASKEVQLAEVALRDLGGPKKAPAAAAARCTAARPALLLVGRLGGGGVFH